MWLGAVVTSQDGVDMMESFTVGSSRTIGNEDFGALAGLVYPTDGNRLCNSAGGLTKGGVKTRLTNLNLTLNS